MKISICGQEYAIFYETGEENQKLNDCECDGYCEPYAKEIHIRKNEYDKRNVKDICKYECKVLRHEIIHALLFECGATDFWENETIVDMFAMLFPKLEAIMAEAIPMFEKTQSGGKNE